MLWWQRLVPKAFLGGVAVNLNYLLAAALQRLAQKDSTVDHGLENQPLGGETAENARLR
jgi:hypothetical protein